MSTSERKRVVEEHQAKVALYDRLQAKGVKDKPRHAMVHKRISTHMKQALHAADDAGKTLITIIIYNIIPFTHMKQAHIVYIHPNTPLNPPCLRPKYITAW